jgi:hypothetical protein
MRQRASKRIDIDVDFRLDLESQKKGTGVHANYLGIITSVLGRHPDVKINPRTLINWFRRWCELDEPIPEGYSPKCEHERGARRIPVAKSPNATPVFGIPEPAIASKVEPEVINVTTSKTKIDAIRIGIDDRYTIIVSNGIQELKVSSENGILLISRP